MQKLKAEKSISFAEARKAAAAENESRPSHDTRTAAEVVRLRSKPRPPATRSIKVQTELTWPNNQDTPTMVPTSIDTSQTVYTTHSKHSQTSPPVSTAMASPTAAAKPDTPMRPNRKDQERKHALSAGPSATPPRSGSRETDKSPPTKGKHGTNKARKINLNRPSLPVTEDPVTVRNRYGVLDQEGDNPEVT